MHRQQCHHQQHHHCHYDQVILTEVTAASLEGWDHRSQGYIQKKKGCDKGICMDKALQRRALWSASLNTSQFSSPLSSRHSLSRFTDCLTQLNARRQVTGAVGS